MGRHKKSIAEKKFQGTYRKYRDANTEIAEKQLKPIMTTAKDFPVPDSLTDKKVIEAYKKHIQMLEKAGYLCNADYPELEAAYVYLQKLKGVETILLDVNPLDEDFDLIVKRYSRLQKAYSDIACRYLLSPTSRLKLILDDLTAHQKQNDLEKNKDKEKPIMASIVDGDLKV